MMIVFRLLAGLSTFHVNDKPSPGTNVNNGRTVSSICFRMKEEIVRGMANPDPTPTMKANA